MEVATPHYAADVARELARLDGETFEQLTGETRDRYWRYAAWITDDYVTNDDFHEGCMPAEVHYDGLEEAFTEGYTKGRADALEAIATVGRGETGDRQALVREVYKAARPSESGETIRWLAESYVRSVRDSE